MCVCTEHAPKLWFVLSFRLKDSSFMNITYCCDECNFHCLPRLTRIKSYGHYIFVHVSMNWFEICPIIICNIVCTCHTLCECMCFWNQHDDELWNSCRTTNPFSSLFRLFLLEIFHWMQMNSIFVYFFHINLAVETEEFVSHPASVFPHVKCLIAWNM